MREKYSLTIASVFLMAMIMSASAWAVPRLINFEGVLTDKATGGPLEGTFDMNFYLFDEATEGIQLWGEQQSVAVTNGIYSVQLGEEFALTADHFTNDNLYLEVSINNPQGGLEILSPRMRLTSTAFSMNADMVDGKHAHELGGMGAAGSLHLIDANGNDLGIVMGISHTRLKLFDSSLGVIYDVDTRTGETHFGYPIGLFFETEDCSGQGYYGFYGSQWDVINFYETVIVTAVEIKTFQSKQEHECRLIYDYEEIPEVIKEFSEVSIPSSFPTPLRIEAR